MGRPHVKLKKRAYEAELERLQDELVNLQEWVRASGHRVLVIFEGRDAAGKGGVIKRITAPLSPRLCKVVALPKPTERERGQWYFQRYLQHLPAAGEIVIFDRSWYNRAGVERVMGFCDEAQLNRFWDSVVPLEQMLIDDGIQLIKYWFSVSDDEQERRFQARIDDPAKRWKLSPMDMESRTRWVEYSRAKDDMIRRTHTDSSPWHIVKADDKKRARLNCISHLLASVPYEATPWEAVTLPPRQPNQDYVRPPFEQQNFIPELW